MRPVPVPTREEPGAAGWIIAATETVINPVSFEQLNQTADKGSIKCSSEEGVGGSMLQNRAI
jgi:hypothetical protein